MKYITKINFIVSFDFLNVATTTWKLRVYLTLYFHRMVLMEIIRSH